MAKSHKPIIWGLFAGGGMVSAFVTPVMILITGLAVPFHLISREAMSYDRVHAFASNPIGKLLLFVVIFLPAWHAAHRLRITAHDFGLRQDIPIAVVLYVTAAVGTIMTISALLKM
ncbi:MAG: fumarate reductase subunit D [Alphaproteobacteria bacterium]|nr:fumarate reductase subunit D [Alphaproteobacteria bacterium]